MHQDVKRIDILNSRMAYVAQGTQGDPIVFVHVMPTSSFLWRKVVPVMADIGRCYAPDLIGMGQSDKSDIAYTTEEHIAYFKAIKALFEEYHVGDARLGVGDWLQLRSRSS